jgi:hypothetical protein
MFLLRCLFWLGLVFSQIAQLEGSTAASFAGQAAARAAGGVVQQAGGLGQMAAQAVEKQCRANSAQCLGGAAFAAQAVLSAQGAKADGAAGHDSLTASDRAPAWRETHAPEKRL